MTPNLLIFAPLLAASLLFFSWSCYKRLSLVAVGPRRCGRNCGALANHLEAILFGARPCPIPPIGTIGLPLATQREGVIDANEIDQDAVSTGGNAYDLER